MILVKKSFVSAPLLPHFSLKVSPSPGVETKIFAIVFWRQFRRKSFAIIYEDYTNLSTISLSFEQKRQKIHPIFKSRTRENNYRTLNIGSIQLKFLRDNFFSQYACFWRKRNFATLHQIFRIQLKFSIFAKMENYFRFNPTPPLLRPCVSQVLSSLFRVMPVSWENMGD